MKMLGMGGSLICWQRAKGIILRFARGILVKSRLAAGVRKNQHSHNAHRTVSLVGNLSFGDTPHPAKRLKKMRRFIKW
jgi:hypothetical protein